MKKLLLIFLLLIITKGYSQSETNLIHVPEVWENDIWDGANWNLASQVNYTFNSNCLAIEGLAKFKDIGGSEMLENTSFLTIIYNANDLPIESINQLWNKTTSQWNNQSRTIFSYSGTNLTETTVYNWVSENWLFDYRVLNTYSTDNLIIDSIRQIWDNSNSIWINDSKQVTTYNTNGTRNVETSFNWDSSNAVWVNNIRSTYAYNASSLQSSIKTDKWETSTWENNRLRTYTYNSSDFLIETLKTKWNGSAFENKDRILRTNNNDGFPTEMINQTWLFGSWLSTSRDRRMYPDCLTLSIQNTKKTFGNIYPNPTTSVIYIDSLTEGNYILTNVSGQVLQKGSLSNGKNIINIDHLIKGLYFINITSRFPRIIKKIIKQ